MEMRQHSFLFSSNASTVKQAAIGVSGGCRCVSVEVVRFCVQEWSAIVWQRSVCVEVVGVCGGVDVCVCGEVVDVCVGE